MVEDHFWQQDDQVFTLMQERFPDFEEALRADIAVSDALIFADRRTAANIVDGATST